MLAVLIAAGPILARIGGTLIDIYLATGASVARLTDALVTASLVEASSSVFARMRCALVDVLLAAVALEAARTIAPEGAGRVDTNSTMLAGRATDCALVDVDLAKLARITKRARALCATINGRRVALAAIETGILGIATVVKLTQETLLAGQALAIEVANIIVALAAASARIVGAIVYVFAAIVAGPAVDADALVAAKLIVASGAVLANVCVCITLINVFVAIGPSETLRT